LNNKKAAKDAADKELKDAEALGDPKKIDEAKKKQEEATEALGDYEKQMQEVEEGSKEGWNSIEKGIDQVGSALTTGGIAVGMIGQAFIDAGAEKFGKDLQEVGSVMTLLGTIISFVTPLLGLLKTAFAGAGAAGASSGAASSAAWGVVGIIVMAVMAAILVTIAIILLVMKAIENSSPEAKLKAAEESAKGAAE
jgi:Na+/proline symporter